MKINLFSKNSINNDEVYRILKPFIGESKLLVNIIGNKYTLNRKLTEDVIFNGIKELCRVYNLKKDDDSFVFNNISKNIFEIRLDYENSPENLVLFMSLDEFLEQYGSIPENEPKNHSKDIKELRCPFCGSYFFRSVYVEDVEYFKDEDTGKYEEGWRPGADWVRYCCDNCYSEIIF